jgi:hypothetical protein
MEKRSTPETTPKSYEAPQLVTYGRLSELTQGKGGGGNSGHGGSRS